MGIEYYLVNREDKTFFDLGKGSWYTLKDDIEAFHDKEYLSDLILNDVFDPDIGKEYTDWLADELIKFVGGTELKHFLIFGDGGDEPLIMKGLDFKCVGARYKFETEQERQEHIDRENRHLNGNYDWKPSENEIDYFMNTLM